MKQEKERKKNLQNAKDRAKQEKKNF